MSTPTEGGRIAAQRFKESAFNKTKRNPTDNATRQRKALARMSLLERELGMTHDEWRAFHAEQRKRVRQRYGLDEAA